MRNSYTTLVIDDEPHAIEALKKYIQATPELLLLETFQDPLAAIRYLKDVDRVDLILLDVDMPQLSGIELAKIIKGKTRKLVFTTGHSMFAYDAFELAADAFLLKPYTLSKFIATIEAIFNSKLEPAAQNKPFFFVRSKADSSKLVRLNYADIISVESRLNYIKISTKQTQVITYMSLTEMATMLEQHSYLVQVHRSFIANLNHIVAIEGNMLEMVDGQKITVGDSYRKEMGHFIATNTLKTQNK